MCDESGHGALSLNLCSVLSVGAVLTSQQGVEDHQLSVESFLSQLIPAELELYVTGPLIYRQKGYNGIRMAAPLSAAPLISSSPS